MWKIWVGDYVFANFINICAFIFVDDSIFANVPISHGSAYTSISKFYSIHNSNSFFVSSNHTLSAAVNIANQNRTLKELAAPDVAYPSLCI